MAHYTIGRKGFVEIPQMTLNALKGLLFSDKGTDLSNLINDLSLENDDLVAINVALVHKGLTPTIDKTPRYKGDWKAVYRYEVVGFSLILGVIKVKSFVSRYAEEKMQDWEEQEGIKTYGLEDWESFPTDYNEALSSMRK